jgi:hypothetical protein
MHSLLLLTVLAAVPSSSQDAVAIGVYRNGLQSIIRHLQSQPVKRAALPTRDERQEARLLWRSFLDYQLALESIRAANCDFL